MNVMVNIRFFISYDGTKYDGWQRQGNTDRTVQGKLEAVLSRLFHVPVEIQGSGRTDAGVHAKAQVANFRVTQEKLDEAAGRMERELRQTGQHSFAQQSLVTQIQKYVNVYLPEDICVYGMERTAERFHSRLSAVGKTYCYRIWTAERKPIFERKYVWYLPEELNVEAMRQAAEYLIGTHDYASFCGNPKMKKSTVRTIDRLEITEDCGLIRILVHGDGFLQNMVRILTGTLTEVGMGHLSAEQIPQILAEKKRTAAGPMAPAQGLCLEQVDYEIPYRSGENVGCWLGDV